MSDNTKVIWDYLAGRIHNAYGTAGLMGNLYYESGLNPMNLQNSYEKLLGVTDKEYTDRVDSGLYTLFDADEAGYGLAQWTFSARKKQLREFCHGKAVSVGDLTAQLEFLVMELQEYSAVWDILVSAKSIREASDAVLTKYERPADQSDSMKEKRAAKGQEYFNTYAAKVKRTGKEFMSARELCEKLVDVAKNYKTIYMYACYGFKVDTYNIQRKAKQNLNGWYTRANIAKLEAVANRTPTWWGFDCVNLLKGILWGWDGDASKEQGGAVYGSHGVPDTNANGMIQHCYDVSEDFGSLLPGEGLWMDGHWGTYIGDGLAVECTSRWDNCVQITAVWNIGKKEGYHGREWTKHGKLPWIAYDGQVKPVPPDVIQKDHPTVKRGSTGDAVKELQEDLMKLGYDVGPDGADGDFGYNTERGVKAFQSVMGLKVDGIVGEKTWAVLDEAVSDQARERVTVAAGTWNVRSGPGTEFASIGICRGGDTLAYSGELDNNWVGVIYHDTKAWISKKAVRT